MHMLHELLVQADPEEWSVDQVCEWLDQIGLGYYAAIFQGIPSYGPHIV